MLAYYSSMAAERVFDRDNYPQSKAGLPWYPRSFGPASRRRFRRHRHQRYVEQIGDAPSQLQFAIIDAMLVSEWEALKMEREGKLREARIARGTFRQGLLDFERTLSRSRASSPSRAEKAAAKLLAIAQVGCPRTCPTWSATLSRRVDSPPSPPIPLPTGL